MRNERQANKVLMIPFEVKETRDKTKGQKDKVSKVTMDGICELGSYWL